MLSKIVKKCSRCLAFLLIVSMLLTLTACDFFEDDENVGETAKTQEEIAKNKTREGVGSADIVLISTGIRDNLGNNAVRDAKVQLKGDGTDTVTVLVYMNGSNLESDDGEATIDLSEIVDAGYSDKVNILVETLGTRNWSGRYGIASDRSQIYKVGESGLTLLKDDLGQLDCTAEESLRDFIIWGVQNYPADRYILHFWDHGGGPVYGFGYDEWVKDEYAALTIDEMQRALNEAGVYFDFVGMDCCLMSCLEVCCAFYDYCDYMVLSEDFESGLGWNYTNWVRTLYDNPSIPTVELGKIISDDMVSANEKNTEYGDRSIMAVIDMSMLKVLYTAWIDFAYDNEDSLLGKNYSRKVRRSIGGRVLPSLADRGNHGGWNWDYYGYEDYYDADETSMAEYYITDIMEVASSIDSDKSDALSSAINAALVYVRCTESDAGLTGIAVSLPYGDSEYYGSMKQIFLNIGLDSDYVDWLGKFVDSDGAAGSEDHEYWDNYWDGWDCYEDDYDWSDWDYADDSYYDDYWDDCGFDDWEYEDSWNQWYEDDDWDDDCNYCGDDWYYGDDYWYEDDWYGDGYREDDYYRGDYYCDDGCYGDYYCDDYYCYGY